MVRATTPTLTLTIKDESVDLTEARNVYVTLNQGDTFNVTKTGEDIDIAEARKVLCWLSQTESLQLEINKPLCVQINWTYLDNHGNVQRGATNVGSITVTRQLLPEVIA